MKFADLHVHTNKSDSSFTPLEVVKNAVSCGLSAISITDHDSVEAFPEVIEIGAKNNIEIIPGVELSADVNGSEVHILGYYIDYSADWFREKLEFLREQRLIRAKEMVRKLNEFGVNISLDDILALSAGGAVGRMHIAKALHEKGYISAIRDAFKKYIGKDKPGYVTKYKITPKEAIDMIKKLGGVSVFAHPQVMGDFEWIPDMVKDGLQGIEAYHSDHTEEGTKIFLKIAKQYNLVVTGGSDCHGFGKSKILMGTVKVPYELVEKLKERRLRDLKK